MKPNAVIDSLPCPGCGSPVALAGTDTHAVCGHCGRRIWIEEKVQRARDDAAGVGDAEREALAGLEKAIFAEARIRARTRALGMGAIVALPAVIIAAVVTFAKAYLEDWMIALGHAIIVINAALALAAASLGWLLFARSSTINRLARLRFAEINGQALARGPTGQCPSCGATVVAPEPVASFPCAHCHTPLVLAQGLLIRWTADARARAEDWQWQAFDKLLEAELWPQSTWIVFMIALLTVTLTIQSCGELVKRLG